MYSLVLDAFPGLGETIDNTGKVLAIIGAILIALLILILCKEIKRERERVAWEEAEQKAQEEAEQQKNEAAQQANEAAGTTGSEE